MERKLVPQRIDYAVERGLPVAPASSRRAIPVDDESRLTSGASALIILLSSLGLWAIIWVVVASLA
jgi:hypothetical protein